MSQTLSNATTVSLGSYGLDNLVNCEGLPGLKVNCDLSHTNLNHASLMNIINGLANVSGKTLTLGSTLKSRLSSEEIAIAEAKGWSVQ